MGRHKGYKKTPEHIANWVKSRAGWKHTEETKEILRKHFLGNVPSDKTKEKQSKSLKAWYMKHPEAKRGPNNPNFCGGRITSKGYKMIWKPDHPFAQKNHCIFEHRLVMEKHLGRYLSKDEIVHHKDGNKLNNNINNLELTTYPNHRLTNRSLYQDGYKAGFVMATLAFMWAQKIREK